MAGRGGDPRVRKRRRSARKSPGDGRCNAADLHIRDRRIRGGYHLMAGQSERVHFTDGDRLDLRTLAAEQTFHLEAFRRHLLAAHSWGILSGLGLAVDEGAIVIEPGLAVDGYGRVLLLDRPIPIAAQAFVDRDTTKLTVDRKSVVSGKGVSVRVDSGGRRLLK